MNPLAPGFVGRSLFQVDLDIKALIDGLQNVVQNLSPMGNLQDLGFNVQDVEIEGLAGSL
eukprot:4072672-Pyramimonas_sp.AAC.1